MPTSVRVIVVAVAMTAGALAAPAAASITTTAITAPVGGATIGPVAFSEAQNLNPFTVTGTSDGTIPDQVDIACFFQSNDGTPSETVLTNGGVPVAADGSFSLTVDLVWAGARPCLLRAVPAGLNPADLTAFAGPRITAVTQHDYTVGSGPNAGATYDYYDNISSSRGYADFASLGRCAVDDMEPWEPVSGGARQQRTNFTFYCNGYLRRDLQPTPGVHRSSIEVDGADAYVAYAANQIGSSYAWPPMTHSITYDQQDFSSNSAKNGYQFPGEASMTPHTAVTTIPIPTGSDPAAILYTFDSTQGDAVTNPRASTVLSPRPAGAVFTNTGDASYFLHYQLTIPAGGSVTVRKIYSQETTSGALAPLTAEAVDRISPPSLTLSSPDDASTVSNPTITVAGTASDNVGVSSVTVNGQAVTPSGGSFATQVTLAEGANTITVVATDAAGAATTVRRSVTYVKPVTPATRPTDTTPTTTPPPPPPDLPAIDRNGVVSCPARGADCTARASWRSRGKGRTLLATWSAPIRPGASATPRPSLTKAGRRLLRKHSVRALRLVTVVSGTGTPVSARAKVTLRRIKHKKKH